MQAEPASLHAIAQGNTSYRLPRRIFVGAVVSPQSLVSLRFIKRGVVGVGTGGVIRFVEDLDELERRSGHQRPTAAAGGPGSSSRDSSVARTVVDGAERGERSATPVAIPGRGAGAGGADGDVDDLASLPPPALEDEAIEQDAQQQVILEQIASQYGWRLSECELVMLSPSSYLCPGFIDTHTHAPQVPNLGRGQQYELLDWLENVTFPREKKFEDPNYAYKTYNVVVQRMLDAGTTCAAIYATLHEEATMILAEICNERGMRAFVGKCQMDRNSPQDYVEKSCSASMEATRNFVKYCRELKPYGSPAEQSRSASGSSHGGRSASSSSPEMDESVARLTATMNGIMEKEAKAKHGQESSGEAGSSSSSISVGATTEASQSGESRTSCGDSQSSASQVSTGISSTATSYEAHARHHSSMSSHSSASSSTGRGGTGAASIPRKLREMENAQALVQPILTPRFAISCSDALLASISAYVSRDPTLRIQTHLSENGGEIAFTKSLFPFCQTYTDVYDHFSLLTPRTILAHAIHLEEDEMKLIADRKCGISHCPTSNMNLRSGTSRVGEMLNRGIKVGLGTDMSGGFGLSILSAIRDASVVAKVVQFSGEDKTAGAPIRGGGGDDDDHNNDGCNADGSASLAPPPHDFCNGPLPIPTLFYLATLGGAEVCSIAHRVGSLDAGKEFDALLINTDNGCPNLFIEDEDTLEQRFEKMLFCGDDRNIASVFVRGRVVGGSAPIAPIA